MDTGTHKWKYHWSDVLLSIKTKVKGNNIKTMYNMVPYKLKVMHVEYDIMNLSPFI